MVFLAPFAVSVRVTLENGAPGQVDKEVEENTSPVLACSFSLTNTGAQAQTQ